MQGEQKVYDLLEKNQAALVEVIDRLCAPPYELSGDDVRSIVASQGHGITLEKLDEDAAAFL